MVGKAQIKRFQKIVWRHYRKEGRHNLPWRRTRDPYRILVSEVMLQQTQVERVKPFYEMWMKRFPTARALSRAPLSAVLKAWQGLGYNRRAKMLYEAAKALVKLRVFPKTPEALEALPGIGPYTARAVMAFAYNADGIFIETNIRTAVIYHFFPKKKKVDDQEVVSVLQQALPKGKSREWYAALMDYGAHLKRSGIRLNARAKGYTKQKRFLGSARQARGAILKELAKGGAGKRRLIGLFGDNRVDQAEAALQTLLREGLVERRARAFWLPA